MRRAVLVFASFAAVGAACHANPSIDGSKVATIGSAASPAKCPDLCDRFEKLCGYAPLGCVESCADWDDGHRLCVGRAASCQEALQSCTNAPVDEAGADAGEDAPADDAAGE
jgi:hypothetical protein